MPLPGVTIDEERIVSSTGAIALKEARLRLWPPPPAWRRNSSPQFLPFPLPLLLLQIRPQAAAG